MYNYEYFTQFTDFAKKAQQPIQSLLELNLQTLRNFKFIRPEELSGLKKPEDLMEKQIELTLENSQKAINCMEESLKIYGEVLRTYLKSSAKMETKVKNKQ